MSALKTYSNRFASMEQQPDKSWIVVSEVSGLPVYEDDSVDFPVPKRFQTYNAARATMNELTQHYQGIYRR